MTREQEEKLDLVLQRTERIEKRLIGDKIAGTPSLIDDVEYLKQNKADKFDWKKFFSIFAKSKSIIP